MKLYQLREEDRQFLRALVLGTGVILFWRGVWEVSYVLPIIKNPYFVLFVGLFIITVTGYIYKGFDPFSQRYRKMQKLIHDVMQAHKSGEEHEIYYFDEIGKHHHKILPNKIKHVDSEFIVFEEKGHEVFVPIHRLSRIHKGKKVIWER